MEENHGYEVLNWMKLIKQETELKVFTVRLEMIILCIFSVKPECFGWKKKWSVQVVEDKSSR